MYTLILESLLGVRRSGDKLTFDPCIPVRWSSYQIEYRYRSTTYHIEVKNSGAGSGVRSVVVDGIDQADKSIHLEDDREDPRVVVELRV